MLINDIEETVSFGNYIIPKPDTEELKEKTNFVGYDYMIKFNVPYKNRVTYPISAGELFEDLCDQVGLEAGSTDFVNSDYVILGNPFTNNEDCRTVLSNIAQLAGGFAKIGRDNKPYIKSLKNISNLLKVKDVNAMMVKELNATIVKMLSGGKDNSDEQLDGNNYLEDFSKHSQWGEVNSLILRISGTEGENTTIQNEDSVQENGLTEIIIEDNYFLINQTEREKVIVPLWNNLRGIKYLPFKTEYYGYPYLDSGDLIYIQDVEDRGFISYVFNHTFTFNGAFSGKIETSAMTKTQTAYKNTTNSKTKFRQVERKIDKINGVILDIVEEQTEFSNQLTKVEQDINSITQEVQNIQDFEREITESNQIHLNETIAGEGYVLNLKIKGSTENFKYLAPSSTLAPNSTLAPYGDHITLIADKRGRTAPTEEAKEIDIRLEEPLRNLEDVYDELNIADGKCIVTRRIGVDENLELYVLETEGIEEIGYIYIPTFEGNTYLYIKEYYNLEYTAKYIKENEYSEVFATNVELNSKIEQTAERIKQEVNKKVGKEEFGTLIEQNAEAVKYAWNQISEYLQMEVLKGNVSLVVRGENQKLLMSLDKNGQNFYKDNEELLGEMGIQRVDETDYVAFSVPSDYNQTIESGMAWGLTTTSDNKFHPILYVKNFAIENEQSDAWYGQIVLQNSDLVLASLESGIVIGNVRIYGNFLNGIVFEDINTGIVILNINPSNNAMPGYQNGQINILDKISFYANQAGSNTMKIGAEEHYCLMTDDGYLSCDELYAENEISCNTLRAFGHIYCNNGVEPFSLSEKKRNIQKYNNKAIEEVKKTDIFYYNYKEDKENCKKRVGAVIGSDYNCSEEIIGTEGKGIDLYSMISVAYKALQEQQEIIEKQEERITKLEGVINNEKNSV